MVEQVRQPTYKRQRFLLAFIHQLKKEVSATDIQKLVFLYMMKQQLQYYEFIPYKFGAYSFQLKEDIDILRRDGYLCPENSHIQAIGDYQYETIFPIDVERGNALIRKAYRQYPYYTINSEILDKTFSETEARRFRHERQNYIKMEQSLFTIGYEGKSLENFINSLILNDIHLLCDIRKNPLSRKFGFSKNKLEHILKSIGIQYIHIPELGIESSRRRSLNSEEDYRDLFSDYKLTLPKLRPQLEYVYYLLKSNARIALMCYEKEPKLCHRHVVEEWLDETYLVEGIDL